MKLPKVNSLLKHSRQIATVERRQARIRQTIGVEWKDIVTMIWEATAEEDIPIVLDIWDQVLEYQAVPEGQECDDYHGFYQWAYGLTLGCWSLPERLPTSWLLRWRDEYIATKAKALQWFPDYGSGKAVAAPPHRRCDDCHFALNTRYPAEESTCPVCGSDRIAYPNLSKPVGEAWYPVT